MSRSITLLAATLAAGSLLAPALGQAADGGQPSYSKVNRPADNGGPTGDSQIPALNDSQLNANYHGPWYYLNGTGQRVPAPPPGTVVVVPQAAVALPPPPVATYTAPPTGGYAAPPPVYTPPLPAYQPAPVSSAPRY